MRAWILGERGPILADDAPEPELRPNELCVRVRACGLNRVDLAMARGYVHGGAGGRGRVLGVEWAGQVVEVGSEVPGFKVGDRVMGSGAGAFAEYAKADWGRVIPLPNTASSFEEAATLPVALQTMHDAVVTQGRLASGEAVLVQGASSGVGLMGLQVAKEMGAGIVFGTSTTPTRRAKLAGWGADHALDSKDPHWVRQVLDATDGKGVHLVVDQVAGAVANENMRAARVGGRIVNVGRLGGNRAEFDFDLHAFKRLQYIGVTFRTRSHAEVRKITQRLREDLWAGLEAGRLLLPIDRIFTFDQALAALDHMAADAHFGKIVVSLN